MKCRYTQVVNLIQELYYYHKRLVGKKTSMCNCEAIIGICSYLRTIDVSSCCDEMLDDDLLVTGEVTSRLSSMEPLILASKRFICASISLTFCSRFKPNKYQSSNTNEGESESDIASKWVHRESNLMFTLNSDREQRKKSLSLIVNEPLLTTWTGRRTLPL